MKQITITIIVLLFALSAGCKKKTGTKTETPKNDKVVAKDDAKKATVDLKGADANWASTLKKANELLVLLKSVKTIDDVKKHKEKLVTLQIDMLKQNLASAKAASKLDKKGVAAFLKKADEINKKQAKLGMAIATEMARLAKIKGVKEIQDQVMKDVGKQVMPLAKELKALDTKLREMVK